MSSESLGQSYITMSGKRLAALAMTSVETVRAHRHHRLGEAHAATVVANRASLGYRIDRWVGRLLGRWVEPTIHQILTSEREGGPHDLFTPLAIKEDLIARAGLEAEETSEHLQRLATEAGPGGTVNVTARDIAALWGYVAPAAEGAE